MSAPGLSGPPPDMAVRELPASLYLDLLSRCLCRELFPDRSILPATSRRDRWRRRAADLRPGWSGVYRADLRSIGKDWPSEAETMIGRARLDNLRDCCEQVLRDAVPGDLIETGVWRGGATILMRAVLKAYGVSDRCVWVADSFQGVPPPDAARYPADAGDTTFEVDLLAVSEEAVRANFERYGLLDEQVRFLPGWFRDSLPGAPIERLAVLRLDGDLYESTMDALTSLYPKLSPGGFVIVDDYGSYESCRSAVSDYRARAGVSDPIHEVDGSAVYWRRTCGRDGA